MRLRYTPAARGDLDHIYNHIAEQNPQAANRVEQHIRAAIELLPTWPQIGVLTDMQSVRRLPVVRYPYAVFYKIEAVDEEIHILRVLHGRQVKDLGNLPDDD